MSKFHPRSGGRPWSFEPVSEINVTPLVDVMLVLLIIFMVTAPMMTVGVEVDLPTTQAAPLKDPIEPLVISINAKQQIFLQEKKVSKKELLPRLKAVSKNNRTVQIFVRGDKELPYGKIMQLMGTISGAGFEKVALVTEGDGFEQPQKSASKSSLKSPKRHPKKRSA